MQNSFEIISLFLYYRLSEDAFRPLGRNFFFLLGQDVKLYIIHLNVDDIYEFLERKYYSKMIDVFSVC